MSIPYRTAVKTSRQVEFVRLWSDDDDDDDDDSSAKSNTSSSGDDEARFKKPKVGKSIFVAKNKTAAAAVDAKKAKRVSDFDQEKKRKDIHTATKKQRTGTRNDSCSSGTSSSGTRETNDAYDDRRLDNKHEREEAKMAKEEYKQRCAARRVNSTQKMVFSRISTLRLRALPQHSPLVARKLRF
jgi:hypothetical protein